MIKINFKNNLIDFWSTIVFSRQKKIPVYDILKQAYDQKVLLENNEELLSKFIEYFKSLKNQPRSQIFQDIFASFVIRDKFDKTFLEFGATNGLSLSNTFMLEEMGWSGVLSEPDIQWIDSLKKNRPNTSIITKCIWKKSDEKMKFFSSSQGVLSTLEDFKFSDKETMPANSNNINVSDKNIIVETISLNDVVTEYFDGICPSYISIDTEGSELEILASFNLNKYRPKLFTIEHNYTENESKIDEFLTSNSYVRIFRKLTAFDAWYVASEIL